MFPPFEPANKSNVTTLVRDYPLAWVITKAFNATPLPLLAETDRAQTIVSLLGHCGRRNLIVADLRADPRALILFQGPTGYISPGLVAESDWAPTWNYAAVRFETKIEFVGQETKLAVEKLLGHMEGRGGDGWSTSNLGQRYNNMLSQIIAFRAHVTEIRPTFKLGQDENSSIRSEIIDNLEDRDLAEWMKMQAKS